MISPTSSHSAMAWTVMSVNTHRYDWTKVATPVSDADKALVADMWCSETTLEGRPVLDGKVFK